MRILLSRTDSIGDVVLTLPMAGVIKREFPGSEVHFLGKTYTREVVRCSTSVDHFYDWDEIKEGSDEEISAVFNSWNIDAWVHVFPDKRISRIAKMAGIPVRIGTAGRSYHLLTCNRLVRFSRRRSRLHESQLNLKLLRGLKKNVMYSPNDLAALSNFKNLPALNDELKPLLNAEKFKIILHPKSKGSAVEWGLDNFSGLMGRLNGAEYQVIITGTAADNALIGNQLPLDQGNVLNLLGKLSLDQLIAVISKSDCVVAASTGPLHLAGVTERLAIGLFSSRRPIHPGRWSPIGPHATYLVYNEKCRRCRSGKTCDCISRISPERVLRSIEGFRAVS
ncbi:MAG: glycosyltransferase family 9 protein [Vicingaceae bacterium]